MRIEAHYLRPFRVGGVPLSASEKSSGGIALAELSPVHERDSNQCADYQNNGADDDEDW